MNLITKCSALVLCALASASCGPGLPGPGPLVPGLSPDVISLALIALVAVVVIMGVARPAFRQRYLAPGTNASKANEILRMRYAKGEISRDDFLQASRDLHRTGGALPDEIPEA